ncbi:MAG: hypothetical protein H7246_14150 [Phycisphaerae bacterium]|nr:hypothetical protein [Saprospiraceae bacterium]
MATTTKGIRRDAFIRSVRPDPKSNDELVMLQGYIGDSDLDGHLRVYSDPALSDFIELPERDVLYCDPVNTDEDPLGGSRLWVKKTTVFTTGDPRHANRVKSSFLEGDILRAFGNQGGNIPTVVAKEFGINTQFSLPYEICHGPTGALDPNCQFVLPPANTMPSVCFKQTCVQPTCKINCNVSRHPFAFCISAIPENCQVLARAGRVLRPCIGGTIACFGGTRGCFGGTIQCAGGTIQCGGGSIYQPGQTDVVVNPAFQPQAFIPYKTMNCGQTDVFVNPTVQQQYATQTYTGGFDPYQTANYGY